MVNRLLFLFLITGALVSGSCKKDVLLTSATASLTEGRWKSTESYLGTGGPTEWKPISQKNTEYISFNEDNSITGNRFQKYEIIDGKTLNMIDASNNKFLYNYTVSGTTLNLSGYGCIEGCSTKYVRVK